MAEHARPCAYRRDQSLFIATSFVTDDARILSGIVDDFKKGRLGVQISMVIGSPTSSATGVQISTSSAVVSMDTTRE
jgi:hypothetical protein